MGLPPSRTAGAIRRSLFFWLLLSASLVAIGLGVWQWRADRLKVAAQSAPSTVEAGRSAPEFSLPGYDGSIIRLSDMRGKVVLLNFWATWCPPCKAEMPDLDALHREYAQPRNFVVLGMDVEESQADVDRYLSKNPVSFPLALDLDGTVSSDRFRVRAMPTSMIIDRNGVIRDSWTGRISKEAMVARLQRVW